ncbi:MAG: FAD-dependent monooxygenase [Flavobacteriales bacterium]|nr:FAD-dependent monooxygenase [Flavobacteriales bacterium]
MSKQITIVGAGLVGSLLSIYLAKRGYQVTAYERRPDLRKNRISAGRSINLALSDRGWRGLNGVGIAEDIMKVAIPMKGRMMHAIDSKLTFQPYGTDAQAIYSVSRGGLNCVLMDLAEKHGVKIIYNEKCVDIDLKTAKVTFENTESGKISTVNSDRVFSTDGAFSSGRMQMQTHTDRFNYSQTYLEHGYKELTIPPTKDGDFAMDPNSLHIWPRGQFMLIALPNMDKSFTCTLFFPFEGEKSFEALNTPGKMLAFFKETFPDAVELMPTLEKDYFENPTSSLMIVKCFPWTYEDKMAMVGDSAHAIVPFYGQGMNCGFEDCVVLDELMSKYGLDANLKDDDAIFKKVFGEYQLSRKPDGDAIADLAVMNFVEMRDRTADPKFLLQKKIEAKFSQKHPDKWIPLYTMVTYSPQIRYSEALREGLRQESIMERVMRMPDIESKWDSAEVENKILELLA